VLIERVPKCKRRAERVKAVGEDSRLCVWTRAAMEAGYICIREDERRHLRNGGRACDARLLAD
jgi:hypothetical protein